MAIKKCRNLPEGVWQSRSVGTESSFFSISSRSKTFCFSWPQQWLNSNGTPRRKVLSENPVLYTNKLINFASKITKTYHWDIITHYWFYSLLCLLYSIPIYKDNECTTLKGLETETNTNREFSIFPKNWQNEPPNLFCSHIFLLLSGTPLRWGEHVMKTQGHWARLQTHVQIVLHMLIT